MYRAGIAGLGMIGGADPVSAKAIGQSVSDMDGTHFSALSGNDRISIVAGSSRDPGRRERFAIRSDGATVYASLQDMLDHEQLDLLSIATYAPAHEEAAIAAIASGVKVIYCEKPIAQTVSAGQRIVDACDQKGILLVVNHQRRFSSGYRKLSALVSGGKLGHIASAYAQWSKGRLGNVGTHVIDALRMVIGQEAVSVSGLLDLAGREDCRGSDFRDPGGWGMLRMNGGTIVLLDAPDYGATPMRFLINGTEGQATIATDYVTIKYANGKNDSWMVGESSGNSMDVAIAEIVSWLDSGHTFLPEGIASSGHDAVRTLEVISALHTSHARDSAWVELPLSDLEREQLIRSG